MTQPLVLHAAEETLEAVHTRRHATYPAYKPSGVEWLEDVPEHWDVKRLKFLARPVNAKVEADEETTKPYIGMEHIESSTGKLRLPDDVFVPTGVSNVFRSGDVLFGKLRPYLAKATTVDFDGLCSSELMVLRSEGMDRHFLLYALLSDGFIKLVNSSTYGSKMPRANWEFIGGMLTPSPPLEEQQAIARFLDEQTRKIHDLIEAKRSLLDLLKEKRQAVITHAVIRGLDPAAKLKPSGVEWLGDVPEHWDVKSLKYVTSIKSGENITYESIDSIGNYPVYGGNGVRGYTSEHTHDGDFVLIGRQGALCGNVHAASGRIWASEHCAVATPKKVSVRWLRSLLEVMDLRQYSETAAQPGLAVEKVLRLRVPYPSIAEQKIIARFLDEETERMDDLESVVREAIETLELLRAGIISAAVTGKIDVREEGV